MAKAPKQPSDSPRKRAGEPAPRSGAKEPGARKPKLSTGKASKPDLKPLDTYLAELLNPAVNREREEAAGFAESVT